MTIGEWWKFDPLLLIKTAVYDTNMDGEIP